MFVVIIIAPYIFILNVILLRTRVCKCVTLMLGSDNGLSVHTTFHWRPLQHCIGVVCRFRMRIRQHTLPLHLCCALSLLYALVVTMSNAWNNLLIPIHSRLPMSISMISCISHNAFQHCPYWLSSPFLCMNSWCTFHLLGLAYGRLLVVLLTSRFFILFVCSPLFCLCVQ